MRIEKQRREAIKELDTLRTRLVRLGIDGEAFNEKVTLSADDVYNIISALEIYITRMEGFYEY